MVLKFKHVKTERCKAQAPVRKISASTSIYSTLKRLLPGQ